MQVSECSFAGIEKCLKLSDGKIELIVTLSFGPRIISCTYAGGANFFKVWEDQCADPSAPGWHNFGGHRLWHAPEAFPRTYAEDNTLVAWHEENGSVVLTPDEETGNRLKKTITIRIQAGKVFLHHTITNTGDWAKEFSVWPVSVMAAGTTLIVPQEPYVPHGCGEGETLLPARPVVVWPYTDMSDPRFTWGRKSIQMREFGGPDTKLKFGVLNKCGFVAAQNAGGCLVKYYKAEEGAIYPDMGINCEFFTMPGMLEIELLSPCVSVAPGASASLDEEWELFAEMPEFVRQLIVNS